VSNFRSHWLVFPECVGGEKACAWAYGGAGTGYARSFLIQAATTITAAVSGGRLSSVVAVGSRLSEAGIGEIFECGKR